MRFFWFRERLLVQSFQEAGGKRADRLEWLRRQLAVAYNWSHCDRIAKLHLAPRDAIPAVDAFGLPVRAVQIRKGDHDIDLPEDEREYFRNYSKYSAQLPGGASQLFLYLLPEDQVLPCW